MNIPTISNAVHKIEGNQVIYTCTNGYMFRDGRHRKVYDCDCLGMLGLHTCIGKLNKFQCQIYTNYI